MHGRIVANWKMQLTTTEAVSLARQLRPVKLSSVQLVVCPAFPALAAVSAVLKGSTIRVGAQTMGRLLRGPLTGEVSPLDVKAAGCRFVILGHSDRRKMGETNEHVAAKVELALQLGLTPIVCVGETAAEYKAKKSKAVVKEQLTAVWNAIPADWHKKVWLAYEPVWAISPGGPIEPRQAHAMVRHIWAVTRQRTPLIYGGSVTPQNASQYVDGRHCDGVLVGNASLSIASLLALANS